MRDCTGDQTQGLTHAKLTLYYTPETLKGRVSCSLGWLPTDCVAKDDL